MKEKIVICSIALLICFSSMVSYAQQAITFEDTVQNIGAIANETRNIITFRSEDNILLLNNKPFFPIGDYGNAREPFNCHTYNSTTTEFWLQQYQGNNKIFFGGNILFSTLHGTFWEEGYQEVLWGITHPNFMGWYSLDEPVWNYDRGTTNVTLNDLLSIYERIKGNETYEGDDPHHVVWMNFAAADVSDDVELWVKKRQDYAQAADVISVDVYNKGISGCPQCYPGSPWCVLDNPHLSVIGDFVDLLKNNVTLGEKPIFIVPQAWGDVNESEIRFQCYQAIIHGVNGIFFWWSAGGGGQWHLVLPDAENVAQELANLHDVLVAPTRQVTVTPTSGIETMVKRYHGDIYILSVNREHQGITANFNVSSLGLHPLLYASTAEIINEDTYIDISQSTFSLYYTPFDTHIIRIERTMIPASFICQALED
jgi:hypothetical protein